MIGSGTLVEQQAHAAAEILLAAMHHVPRHAALLVGADVDGHRTVRRAGPKDWAWIEHQHDTRKAAA